MFDRQKFSFIQKEYFLFLFIDDNFRHLGHGSWYESSSRCESRGC